MKYEADQIKDKFRAVIKLVETEAAAGRVSPDGRTPRIVIMPGGLAVVTGEPFAGYSRMGTPGPLNPDARLLIPFLEDPEMALNRCRVYLEARLSDPSPAPPNPR